MTLTMQVLRDPCAVWLKLERVSRFISILLKNPQSSALRHRFFFTDSLRCLQDALVELSEQGIVLIVEESGCLQAKVYLQREVSISPPKSSNSIHQTVESVTLYVCEKLFTKYEYGAEGRPRFGISLGLLVDCLNTFSSPGHSNTIEIKYPGPDMELLLKSVDTLNSCIYSEIRTRIPETSEWDYNFEQAGTTPITFTVKSAALKEAIDDLEWPGSRRAD
ncbi:damaged DNA binding [Raphanus sativus]|nr:damaged DNA binding [Raphanus sativus]